jgi:SAM-dependent methyltransferase
VARAEESGLEAGSVDLVTVAQALHWFDIDAFFVEAQRVLRPDGVVAFWCYQNCTIDAHCDAVVRATFDEVEDYWPPERDIVENQYPHIPMPFDEIGVPPQSMCLQWRAEQLLAYMNTWSATQRCLAATGRDPVGKHAAALLAAWGPGERTVRWPLVLRAGRRRA